MLSHNFQFIAEEWQHFPSTEAFWGEYLNLTTQSRLTYQQILNWLTSCHMKMQYEMQPMHTHFLKGISTTKMQMVPFNTLNMVKLTSSVRMMPL
jgi:hypothetical protein